MNKITKILIVVLIIIIFVLVADALYCRTISVEPDELYLSKENSEESIQATKGSYTWKERGLIKYVNVVSDSVGPTSIDYNQKIEAKSGEKIYFSDSNWSDIGASLILQKDGKDVAILPIESNIEERYIIVPQLVNDEYVVKIDLKSDNGEVWYSAKIVIND